MLSVLYFGNRLVMRSGVGVGLQELSECIEPQKPVQLRCPAPLGHHTDPSLAQPQPPLPSDIEGYKWPVRHRLGNLLSRAQSWADRLKMGRAWWRVTERVWVLSVCTPQERLCQLRCYNSLTLINLAIVSTLAYMNIWCWCKHSRSSALFPG